MTDPKSSEQADARPPGLFQPGAEGGGDSPACLHDRLSDVLERLRTLEQIVRRQREVFAQGDAEAIMRVVDDRQRVMEGVERVSSVLDTARSFVEGAQEVPDLEALNGLISSIESLANDIGKRDGEDRAQLERARDELAGKLAGTRRSQAAFGAYTERRPDVPSFQDTQG